MENSNSCDLSGKGREGKGEGERVKDGGRSGKQWKVVIAIP